MQILGLEIAVRRKAAKSMQRVDSSGSGGWWPIIRESYTGAWQLNAQAVSPQTVLAYWALYACVTLIAEDIAKMGLRLLELRDGIWSETESPAFSPVLRKPNHYQTRIQFFTSWMVSKLTQGNTYSVKARDARGVVRKLYLLNPNYVTPLVAPDGSVFYELRPDASNGLMALAGLLEASGNTGSAIVPAREIIHDVCVPLFHPLIGVTPIYACGVAAMQGLSIQNNSNKFFSNGSQPGGVLTAPGTIATTTADRVKTYWETEFSGDNTGKIAVLGDGLKYEPLAMKAVDAQLIEQLKWTGESVCGAHRVPPYKIGIGQRPAYNGSEVGNLDYYSQALQPHVESIELLLDEGIELPTNYGTEFDVSDLARMDSAAKMKFESDGVSGGIFTPNEARRAFNRRALPGGDSVYLQQQYFSLEALNRRNAAPPPPPAAPATAPAAPEENENDEAVSRAALELLTKAAEAGLYAA